MDNQEAMIARSVKSYAKALQEEFADPEILPEVRGLVGLLIRDYQDFLVRNPPQLVMVPPESLN